MRSMPSSSINAGSAIDFDMIQNRWDQSLSPGNEQWFYWGSEAADDQGTRNYMGAKDPAIDAMIAAVLAARERPAFVSAVRALDRTLMSGFYAIPLFNVREQWIARWNWIERPATTALTGYLPETWWQRPAPQSESDPVIQTNASPTLDGLFRRILARQPDALALLDPLNKPRVTGQAAEAPDLRAGRPGHLGAGGAFHRSRAAGQFRDRGSIAEHRRIHADGAGGASRRA